MKVNLYYAPYPSQIFAGSADPVNTERPFNPKSALTTLATGLRMFSGPLGLDCEVEIIDMQVGGVHTYYKSIPYGPHVMDCYRLGYPFEEMEAKIREGDIHGISSNHTNASQIVVDLAKFIKRLCPESLVVVGGTDATARPYYYLDNGVDVVVKGEGEYVFSLVVEAWLKRTGFDAIPSICTRERPGGTDGSLKQLDMNTLEPMSLDLVADLSIYTDTAEGPPPAGVKPNFICFETSRGCAWTCSFCTAPGRGRFRYMSPSSVEKHFRYFRSLGIRTIVWQEDNPLSRAQQSGTGRYLYDQGRAEVLEIFHLAREYGFAWEFANGLEFGKFRPNGSGGALDYELMDALLWNRQDDGEWLGCYRVQIPLDNLDLEEKKRFPKLLDFEGQLQVLAAMLEGYGVAHQTYDLFIGYPEQDRAVLDRFTRGCLRIKEELGRLRPDFNPYFNVFNLALLPGAKDYERLRHLLAFDIDKDPEVVGIFLSATNTEHFTYYETYQKRVEMCNLLNDQDMIRRYDGIYTGRTSAAPSPVAVE